MNRLKALYRSWGIPSAGTQVYGQCHREQWLNKIPQAGVRRRAGLFYQQLDGFQVLRSIVRAELLAESLNWGDAAFLRHEKTMRSGSHDALLRGYRGAIFSATDREQGNISGLLLDFRLQMRCSGANESALTQTKQRKYRWAQTEPDF
jgi:hypothetical protein